MPEHPSLFHALGHEFVEALSTGKVMDFSRRLVERLAREPRSLCHWVFLARARETERNLDGADACYQQALHVADPSHRNDGVLRAEVRQFAMRHARQLLLEMVAHRDVVAPVGTNARARQRDQSRPAGVRAPIPPVKQEEVKGQLDQIERAYAAGDRSPEVLLRFGQLLQRDGQLERALEVLLEGLNRDPNSRSLLNARAQILSASGRWAEAADGYKRLAEHERQPGARRFFRMQLALMLRRSGNLEDSRGVLDRMLREDPHDLELSRLRRALDQPYAPPDLEDHTTDGPPDADEEEGSPGLYLSQLLVRDLEKVEFRDEAILAKGGKPDLDDADRLLRLANGSKAKPFGERYPLFQEAAKAYTRLQAGTWDPIDFLGAVSRYALLKGGALMLSFRGQLVHDGDKKSLRRLRDSIASYSLETIDALLQRRRGRVRGRQRYTLPGFVFQSLTNHLWTQVAYAQGPQGAVPLEGGEGKFLPLFEFCMGKPQTELPRLAWESLVACGALSRRFLEWLKRIPDGERALAFLKADGPQGQQCRALLEQLSGEVPVTNANSLDLLHRAIDAWVRRRQEIDEFFSRLERIKPGPGTFARLQQSWQEFPRHPGPMLSTDFELADGVQKTLAPLASYDTRGGEERAMLLSLARRELEDLLRLIEQAPTYWGRVRFEPLLKRWRTALANLESMRLGELKPLVEVSLEPPVFRELEGCVVGTVLMRNTGRATAEGVTLQFEIRAPGNPSPVWRPELIHQGELPVGGLRQVECRIPRDALTAGLEATYTLEVAVRPSSESEPGDEVRETFTLEIDRGGGFGQDEIPWDEVKRPDEHLFKGRQRDLEALEHHLRSPERNKTPLLVGLTRTGKSTLLQYLGKGLQLRPTGHSGGAGRFLCLEWNLLIAASYGEERGLWRYLLYEQLVNAVRRLEQDGQLADPVALPPVSETEVGFQDWRPLLVALRAAGLYPVFLIDEFTGYLALVDKKLVGPPFLAAVREFAIEGLASFVFAGTYELRRMISDPAYGITGQLVNVLERRVGRIDEQSAQELVNAMAPRLRFTDEATAHILRLSFCIPYFIQLLCKRAALVAAATGRGWVGYPDLERVVRVLAGETDGDLPGGVQSLAPGVFQNNMHFPQDPAERHALLTTICCLSRDPSCPDVPRLVPHEAILQEWERHRVPGHERKAATALAELKERQVLIERDDEGRPSYMISVDLFRRWWGATHRYLKPDLDLLK